MTEVEPRVREVLVSLMRLEKHKIRNVVMLKYLLLFVLAASVLMTFLLPTDLRRKLNKVRT